MGEGWFRVSRSLTDARHDLHPQSSDEPACRLGAWVDLIGYARWDDGGGLKRGQLRAGVRFLAARWNWSKSRVSRFLCSLEDAGRISRGTQAGRVPDIITICNYESYQDKDWGSGTRAGRERVHERDANEDKEEEVQEEEKTARAPAREEKRKRRRQLPEDWKPHEKHADRANDLDVDLEDEAEAFREHHRAHGKTMLDWDQAFYTWLRNTQKYGTASGGSPSGSSSGESQFRDSAMVVTDEERKRLYGR